MKTKKDQFKKLNDLAADITDNFRQRKVLTEDQEEVKVIVYSIAGDAFQIEMNGYYLAHVKYKAAKAALHAIRYTMLTMHP